MCLLSLLKFLLFITCFKQLVTICLGELSLYFLCLRFVEFGSVGSPVSSNSENSQALFFNAFQSFPFSPLLGKFYNT